MSTRDHKREKFPRILAPFLILRVEKMYFSWIASFAISFMSILVDLVNNSIDTSFRQGAFYSTCIALLAPFLVEFFVEYIAASRAQKPEKYTTYKGASLLICFVVVFLLCVFYATAAKSNPYIQIISTILVGFFSLYLYLVSKMGKHETLLASYKDVSYVEAEQKALETLTAQGHDQTSVTVEEGVEVKL